MKRKTDQQNQRAKDGTGALKKKDGGRKFKPNSPKPKLSKKVAMKEARKAASRSTQKKKDGLKRKNKDGLDDEKDQAGTSIACLK